MTPQMTDSVTNTSVLGQMKPPGWVGEHKSVMLMNIES